jgi:hypothetical protein
MIIFLNTKVKYFEKIKIYEMFVENQTINNLKVIRYVGGTFPMNSMTFVKNVEFYVNQPPHIFFNRMEYQNGKTKPLLTMQDACSN